MKLAVENEFGTRWLGAEERDVIDSSARRFTDDESWSLWRSVCDGEGEVLHGLTTDWVARVSEREFVSCLAGTVTGWIMPTADDPDAEWEELRALMHSHCTCDACQDSPTYCVNRYCH